MSRLVLSRGAKSGELFEHDGSRTLFSLSLFHRVIKKYGLLFWFCLLVFRFAPFPRFPLWVCFPWPQLSLAYSIWILLLVIYSQLWDSVLEGSSVLFVQSTWTASAPSDGAALPVYWLQIGACKTYCHFGCLSQIDLFIPVIIGLGVLSFPLFLSEHCR